MLSNTKNLLFYNDKIEFGYIESWGCMLKHTLDDFKKVSTNSLSTSSNINLEN